MSANLQAQALRFLRLFAAALVAQLATLGVNNWGWKVLAGAVVGAAEVVFRQLYPAATPAAHAVAPPAPVPPPVN